MVFLGLLGNLKVGLAIQDPTTVSLNPALSHQIVGKDIFVDVVISNIANLNFWEFKLYYETNSLNALDATEGPFLKSHSDVTIFIINQINDAYNSTHGLVWVTGFAYGTRPATGNVVLATIKFRGTNSGTSHIALAYPEFPYPVVLCNTNSEIVPCTTTTGADVLIVGPESVPLDITIDVGPLYFAEEQAELYIMTTYRGIPLTPTSINAVLYNPDGESMSLAPQPISTGFYKATYTMPSDAPSGTWAIVVEATYLTDDLQAHGISFKTFLLSLTLNSKLVSIEDTVAWIQTNVGLLKTDISNLKMRVTAIEGSTATIQTTLGTIQGTITSVSNNIATIRTDLGTVKLDVSTVKTNTLPKGDWTTTGLYVSLGLLVPTVIVLVVLYLYMRARFRSGTVPS